MWCPSNRGHLTRFQCGKPAVQTPATSLHKPHSPPSPTTILRCLWNETSEEPRRRKTKKSVAVAHTSTTTSSARFIEPPPLCLVGVTRNAGQMTTKQRAGDGLPIPKVFLLSDSFDSNAGGGQEVLWHCIPIRLHLIGIRRDPGRRCDTRLKRRHSRDTSLSGNSNPSNFLRCRDRGS